MQEVTSPFDPTRLLGGVCEVTPGLVKVTAPAAANSGGKMLYGLPLGTGQVGEFVVIQTGLNGVLGRVTRVALSEKERLSAEPSLSQSDDLHPVALVQLLATLDLTKPELVRGIAQYPRLGDRVYSAPPSLVRWVAECSAGATATDAITIELGWVARERSVVVKATPERLFGRHCAILGTTGGGKSYTLARIVEQSAKHHCKIIVLDATGEYEFDEKVTKRLALGRVDRARELGGFELVSMPHRHLTIPDLFAIFQPSGKVQGPTLRRAITSLKLVDLEPTLKRFVQAGVLVKADSERKPFEDAQSNHAKALQIPSSEFDILSLGRQILAECVFETTKFKPGYFGEEDKNNATYCISLVNRIEGLVHAAELACVFKPGTLPSLTDRLTEFFSEDSPHRILHLSLRDLAFDFNAREVVANAIGRYLLHQAREDRFRAANQPVIVFLDEAHHFLNKSIGDEDSRVDLNAFELIAKEGRKYWLTLCLATQQPRDLPNGVLSQVGTLIVHRLINDRDREVVERACGEIDRAAAAFLPTLGPGEAALVGVDFSIPLTVQMDEPAKKPNSRGPAFQEAWKGGSKGTRGRDSLISTSDDRAG